MDEFCREHSEHARAIASHDKRLDSHSRSLDENRDDIYALRVSFQKLTDIEQQNSRIMTDHEKRISALEDQPVHSVQRVKDSILAAVGSLIGTGIITLIVLAIINSIYM